MFYYRFYVLVFIGGNIGVSKGIPVSIITALPKQYPDDCSEDLKLLDLISKKSDKLRDKNYSQIRIIEFEELPQSVFNQRKTKIIIDCKEWL